MSWLKSPDDSVTNLKSKRERKKNELLLFLWSLFAFLFAFLWQVALFSQAKRKIYTHSKMFSWKNSHSPCLLPLPTMSHCPKIKMNGNKTSKIQFHFSGLLGTGILPMLKQETKKKIYNWTSKIIPFICFGKQMDSFDDFYGFLEI